jgi:hypothetical protein
MTRRLSKSQTKRRIKLKRKQCLLLLLPVELFIQIANELSFRQRLTLALDTDFFDFMFMLTEIWSMSIPNLVSEDVEIKSSAHNPKSFLAALEFLIPKNAI